MDGSKIQSVVALRLDQIGCPVTFNFFSLVNQGPKVHTCKLALGKGDPMWAWAWTWNTSRCRVPRYFLPYMYYGTYRFRSFVHVLSFFVFRALKSESERGQFYIHLSSVSSIPPNPFDPIQPGNLYGDPSWTYLEHPHRPSIHHHHHLYMYLTRPFRPPPYSLLPTSSVSQLSPLRLLLSCFMTSPPQHTSTTLRG